MQLVPLKPSGSWTWGYRDTKSMSKRSNMSFETWKAVTKTGRGLQKRETRRKSDVAEPKNRTAIMMIAAIDAPEAVRVVNVGKPRYEVNVKAFKHGFWDLGRCKEDREGLTETWNSSLGGTRDAQDASAMMKDSCNWRRWSRQGRERGETEIRNQCQSVQTCLLRLEKL